MFSHILQFQIASLHICNFNESDYEIKLNDHISRNKSIVLGCQFTSTHYNFPNVNGIC